MDNNEPDEDHAGEDHAGEDHVDEDHDESLAGDNDCIFCEESLTTDLMNVSDKCRETIVQSSLQRNDSLHARLSKIKELQVHKKCYRSYTHSGNIAASLKKRTELSPKKRRSTDSFLFHLFCILCNGDASDTFILKQAKKPRDKREVVCKVDKQSTLDNIQSRAKTLKSKEGARLAAFIPKIDFIQLKNSKNPPRYHQKCLGQLYKTEPSKPKRVRTNDPIVEHVMEFLERNRDECQFALRDILESYKGEMQGLKHICSKLLKYHNDEIIISRKQNREIIICFKDKAFDILTQAWYDRKSNDPNEERKRIIVAAANILLEDVRGMVYDTEFYPPCSEFYNKIREDVPETLQILLDTLCTKNKKGNLTPYYRQSVNMAHSLIKIIRPNSFISPIQVGAASLLHEKTGCKDIVNLFSNYGYTASYIETKRFRKSQAQHLKDTMENEESLAEKLENCTIQFVYDNADHNVRTLDGSGTFHAMGGVMIITPYQTVTTNNYVPRLKQVPTAEIVSEMGGLELLSNEIKDYSKLSEITFENLDDKFPHASTNIAPSNFLWAYSKTINSKETSGRNGFLEKLTIDKTCDVSKIVFLPFLNAPPSHEDTIYTVLMESVRKVRSYGKKYAIVTFDLPLFMKAFEMISCAPDDSDLKFVILRLGGFHTLMSYLKAVGFIMKDSGLKDLLCLTFGQNSVDKVFECSNYARTLRCHELAYLALIKIVISEMKLTELEKKYLEEILKNIDGTTLEKLNHPDFQQILDKFHETLIELSSRGPTAKLWAQYPNLVQIGHNFLDSERVGNWGGHLSNAKLMVPIFHASGHFNYAKAVPIYIQQMNLLKDKMTKDEFHRFTELGHFTVRRSDKFRSGTWSDMIIEQTVMKGMKSQGGLTHGRGVEESVTNEWVLSMPALFEIDQTVLDHGNISFNTNSGQHVDASDARILTDNDIVDLFYNWFVAHNPFTSTQEIMCISTGLIADKEKVNCQNAFEIGSELMKETYTGKHWNNIKFQRKNRVTTLQGYNTDKKKDELAIDPALLFHRICVWKRNDDDMQRYLEHELAPYPLPIFDVNGMRKNKKSEFFNCFTPETKPPTFKGSIFIIDGGFLLHRVVWSRNSTYGKVGDQYVDYIKRNYAKNGNTCMIYFDGYPEGINDRGTKNVERIRRKKNCTSPAYAITNDSPTVNQRNFLSNDTNKNNFIQLLKKKLSDAGFLVNQAEEDVDAELVRSAINYSTNYPIACIVAEDVDVLVILSQLAYAKTNIYLLKVGKGKDAKQFYRCDSFKYPQLQNYVSFLHAFSGCDTTSAFYMQGKIKFVDILNNNLQLLDKLQTFYNDTATQAEVEEAGSEFIKYAYVSKPNKEESLNMLRYTCFQKSTAKKAFNLATLPPTESSMKFHSYRVFYQLRLWDKDKTVVDKIKPTDWGWKFIDNYGLAPEMTDIVLVPEELLKIISCSCTTGCSTTRCGCKKVGIHCTVLCKGCEGKNCCNIEVTSTTNDDDDDGNEVMSNEQNFDVSELLNCELAIDNGSAIDEELFVNDDDDEDSTETLPQKPKRARSCKKSK